jgi:hypothetical protein
MTRVNSTLSPNPSPIKGEGSFFAATRQQVIAQGNALEALASSAVLTSKIAGSLAIEKEIKVER